MTERLDLGSLRKAVSSLQSAIAVTENKDWLDQQSEPVQRTLVAGVIQNFEFVYEVATKMIRRQVEMESATPAQADQYSFRDLLRIAAEKGLIDDVEAWFRYRELRGTTSHTYDYGKAQQVYRDTLGFFTDAQALLRTLDARNA